MSNIEELAIKLADAAALAHERGDATYAIFFALKAAECLQLVRLLQKIEGGEP